MPPSILMTCPVRWSESEDVRERPASGPAEVEEKLRDKVAGALLVPTDIVDEFFEQEPTLARVLDFVRRCAVSRSVFVLRVSGARPGRPLALVDLDLGTQGDWGIVRVIGNLQCTPKVRYRLMTASFGFTDEDGPDRSMCLELDCGSFILDCYGQSQATQGTTVRAAVLITQVRRRFKYEADRPEADDAEALHELDAGEEA